MRAASSSMAAGEEYESFQSSCHSNCATDKFSCGPMSSDHVNRSLLFESTAHGHQSYQFTSVTSMEREVDVNEDVTLTETPAPVRSFGGQVQQEETLPVNSAPVIARRLRLMRGVQGQSAIQAGGRVVAGTHSLLRNMLNNMGRLDAHVELDSQHTSPNQTMNHEGDDDDDDEQMEFMYGRSWDSNTISTRAPSSCNESISRESTLRDDSQNSMGANSRFSSEEPERNTSEDEGNERDSSRRSLISPRSPNRSRISGNSDRTSFPERTSSNSRKTSSTSRRSKASKASSPAPSRTNTDDGDGGGDLAAAAAAIDPMPVIAPIGEPSRPNRGFRTRQYSTS